MVPERNATIRERLGSDDPKSWVRRIPVPSNGPKNDIFTAFSRGQAVWHGLRVFSTIPPPVFPQRPAYRESPIMAHRSKASLRRERDSDSMDSIKPLVVLGLLGTILYGAYCVVQNGPGQTGQPWQVPGITAESSMTSGGFAPAATDTGTISNAPPFAPPAASPILSPAAVALPAQGFPAQSGFPTPAAVAGVPAAVAPAAFPTAAAASVAAADRSPTYLNAMSAPPPHADLIAAPGSAVPGSFDPQPPSTAVGDNQPVAMPSPNAPPMPAAQPPARAAPSAAFASAWADAHDKLAAGRYAEALAVLSVWYDDQSLCLEESQQLDTLLGQLAGTVIYSQQDLLLAPHIVAAGDTLQPIAASLSVPWQLLAKINGIDDPAKLLPGEHLKVVRGPFDAVVSVSRRRVSLQVAGNYAGSFPVVIGRQLHDRIGASLNVVDVRRGTSSSEPQGPAVQVAYAPPAGPKSILLSDGMAIEAVEELALMADAVPGSSLVMASRDLDELLDILGPGSHVLVRQ